MSKEDRDDKPVVKKIKAIQLYLMFSTDGDFRVNLDGLTSFIRSRMYKYENKDKLTFHAVDIPFNDGNCQQLIRLEVCRWSTEDPKNFTWAEDVIEQILLPAYMWIFAEIGIGNCHGLPYYFRMEPFTELFDPDIYRPIHLWRKKEFENGEAVLPRVLTMSGNYSGSWAQWRFVLSEHRGASWGTEEFEKKIIKELEKGEPE